MRPVSLRTYAKRRGQSVEAVSKAIETGRLRASVVRDRHGAPKIGDVDLADREWDANTRPSIDRAPPTATPPAPPPAPPPAEPVSEYHAARARREVAAARREVALADLAEIDVAERRGELAPVDEVRRYITGKFVTVKTRILGVPSRLAQRFPAIAAELAQVSESLLREALAELAEDGGHVEDEDEDEA